MDLVYECQESLFFSNPGNRSTATSATVSMLASACDASCGRTSSACSPHTPRRESGSAATLNQRSSRRVTTSASNCNSAVRREMRICSPAKIIEPTAAIAATMATSKVPIARLPFSSSTAASRRLQCPYLVGPGAVSHRFCHDVALCLLPAYCCRVPGEADVKRQLKSRKEQPPWCELQGTGPSPRLLASHKPGISRDQYADLLPVFERVQGPEHPHTLTTRSQLAHWTGQAGDACPGAGRPR